MYTFVMTACVGKQSITVSFSLSLSLSLSLYLPPPYQQAIRLSSTEGRNFVHCYAQALESAPKSTRGMILKKLKDGTTVSSPTTSPTHKYVYPPPPTPTPQPPKISLSLSHVFYRLLILSCLVNLAILVV